MKPEWLQWLENHFGIFQFLLGTAFLLLIWKSASGSGKSFFKLKESDRQKPKKFDQDRLRLENARKKSAEPKKPALLTGIRLDVPPHELLQVRVDATEKEIQSAYHKLMKQYHPDKIAAQGTQAWNDAQAIAVGITQARDALLAKRKP